MICTKNIRTHKENVKTRTRYLVLFLVLHVVCFVGQDRYSREVRVKSPTTSGDQKERCRYDAVYSSTRGSIQCLVYARSHELYPNIARRFACARGQCLVYARSCELCSNTFCVLPRTGSVCPLRVRTSSTVPLPWHTHEGSILGIFGLPP